MLSDWVNGGGNLIAMRPAPQLATLLGLTASGTTLAEGYLAVDTSRAPGARASSAARSSSTAPPTATRSRPSRQPPARSRRSTRTPPPPRRTPPSPCARSAPPAARRPRSRSTSRGRSSTRARATPRGPATSATGRAPVRSDDMFYGDKSGDPQPDWVNLDKVAIPQADEQQRLLANLILKMTADRKPLPRFWYFPRGKKAVVVMAVDNHGSQTVEDRFECGGCGQPHRLLGRRLGVHPLDRLHLHRRPSGRRDRQVLGEQGLRGRAPRQHGLRRLDADHAARLLHQPDGRLLRQVPVDRAAANEPDALHRVERLGDAAEGRARERHPPRHELLLLAAGVGRRPAGLHDRLGHADALRRPRRHDDRRLPGRRPR